MKLIYVDTETTGLDPKLHEAFQLAFIIEVDGEVAAEKNLKLRPRRPETADARALEVTGMTLEKLAALPPREEAYKELVEALSLHVDRFNRDDKLIWVGQNPDFDMPFVRALFEEHDDKYFGSWFDYRAVNLISLAVACRLKGLLNPPNFKLETLCREFGVPLNAHDALEDVRATRAVFLKLLGFIPSPASETQEL